MSVVSEEKSWLEWLVFGLSCTLILAVVGFLIHDARTDAGRPPAIEIRLGQAVSSPSGYLVPVTVTNSGDQTAQALEIEVSSGGREGEKATLSYDFLASGEVREGWAGFSSEPSGLTARVVGFRGD